MKILNIHGYKGCSKNAARKALESLGHNVIAPDFDYDKILPSEVIKTLEKLIMVKKPDIIVGTSYGGFFAAILSAKLKLPVVLVNPCLMPFLHLPRLGYEADVHEFISLFGMLSELDITKISTIIGGCDDVIDTHDFTKNLLFNDRFVIHPDGKHSGATLPLKKFFEKVLKEL